MITIGSRYSSFSPIFALCFRKVQFVLAICIGLHDVLFAIGWVDVLAAISDYWLNVSH